MLLRVASTYKEATVPVTIRDVRGFKERGEKFTMLTAYDALSAHLIDEAGIPLILVGDMPFMSYQGSIEDGMRNAGRFLKEAGANCVKLEGGGRVVDLVGRLT